MLHRSNAEHSLWNGRGSRGEAAGKSWGPGRCRRGARTWPGVVKALRTGRRAGPEYLPKPLR